MKALVTGATGFIGSHLVERLTAEGHQVRALVRNPAGAEFLRNLGTEVVFGDITDPDSFQASMQGVDVVFHIAARVTDWGPWSAFERATVRGTEHVLQTAAEAGISRFLHMSTISVYNDAYVRKRRIVTEKAPHTGKGERALGHYARSKVMAEEAVWRYQREGALAVSVVRPTWVYGPRDETILPRLLEFLRSPQACWIGRKDPVVDPIYVTDVVDCILAAATSNKAVGQAYNVAPDVEIHLREFVGGLCRAFDIPMPHRTTSYAMAALATAISEGWSRLIRRQEPPGFSLAAFALMTRGRHHTPTKAKRDLNWQPKVSLEEGIRLTAAWMQS